MAFASGKIANFTLDNSAGTPVDLSAYLSNMDLDQLIAALETTTYLATGGSKTFLSGLRDGKVGISGYFDPTLDAHMNGVIAAHAAGTLATASVVVGPAGLTTGLPKYSFEAILTDYKCTSPVAGIVTWSATLQVTGAITRGAY